jgi:hypothetical protein
LPEIGPALVLSALVGVAHAALYVLLRGSTRGRLPFIVGASVLGAFAGQALGARLGDPLRIGDFGLLWASLVAWAGILTVIIVSVLAPQGDRA